MNAVEFGYSSLSYPEMINILLVKLNSHHQLTLGEILQCPHFRGAGDSQSNHLCTNAHFLLLLEYQCSNEDLFQRPRLL